MKPTVQSPHCPNFGTVSNGVSRNAASALTWPPHAWASGAALVTGKERVVAGWPGFHLAGPTAPHWRADPFADRIHPNPYVGTWELGRTAHSPPGRNPCPPGQKRALVASVMSCGCDVGYERLGGHERIFWGSLSSAGGCRGDGGDLGGGGCDCDYSHCGDGNRKKRSSVWVGPSPVQDPVCSGCGHPGPWLGDL